MSKEMSIILLGIWLIIVPYLGVPSFWRTVLIVLSGIVIAIMGLLMRGETLSRGTVRNKNHPFIENIRHEGESSYERQENTLIQ